MTSNDIYAASLDRTLNETGEIAGPAFDYSFLPEQYPVPWQLPDLSNQITAFLSMEKPAEAPAETIWIFSFGTWDVWSLAAMPKDLSSPVIEPMVTHIFTELERLYQSSLDENSVAWSNSSAGRASGVSSSDTPKESSGVSGFGPPGEPEGQGMILEPGVEGADAGKTIAPTKHFRIIVPKLFDLTLAPGWLRARPDAPAVHSKAEQLRNAVALTDLWNAYMNRQIHDWVKTSDPVETEETRSLGSGDGPRQYAQRDAIPYDLPAYLMEMLVEGQLQSSGVNDSTGTGTKPANQTFAEVRYPCVIDVSGNQGGVKGSFGVKPVVSSAVESEAEATPPPSVRRRTNTTIFTESHNDNNRANGETSSSSDTPPPQPQPTLRVCDTPQDHLFYTSFTLSQRAITDIAVEVADMVHRNDTVRARWEEAADLSAVS